MPTEWHDSAKKLFERDPELVADILRDLMGVSSLKGVRLTPFPQVISDKPPGDLIPDLLFLAGPTREPVRCIIVEIQKGDSEDKRRQWPRYLTALWTKYGCPVDLLVICPDEVTARWCGQPIPTNLEEFTCRPKPLPPSRVPAITSAEEVAANPGLGVLSVAYHGADPAVADAFVAGTASAGADLGRTYYDYGYDMSADAVQNMLEELMTTTYRWPHSPTLRKEHEAGFVEGKAEGKAEAKAEAEVKGERNTVLMVLKARNLTPTDEQRELVSACDDLGTLKQWAERAVTATSTEDVFK